jgi:hypothetical protein
MHEEPWLPGKSNCSDLDGALCASLVFHALMVVVIASSSANYPATGPETHLDVIWAAPSPLPPDATKDQTPDSQPNPTEAPNAAAFRQDAIAPADQAQPNGQLLDKEEIVMAAATFTPPHGVPREAEKPATPIRHPKRNNPTSRLSALQLPPVPRASASAPRERTAASTEPNRDRPGQEETKLLTEFQENPKPVPPENVERKAFPAPDLPREIRTAAAPEHKAEHKAEPARLAAQQPALDQQRAETIAVRITLARLQEIRQPGPKPAIPAPAGSAATSGGKPGDKPAAAKREPAGGAPAEQQIKAAEKKPPARGLVIAAPRGDLKLVITGDSGVRLAVTFRDYPKSRRSKVLTRSEARRVQQIAPVVTATREDTREAVINTAREGIYIFSVAAEGGNPAKATFTLKVFEAGAREKIAALGTRTLAGTAVLLKILMPEAILWDDDSAFSGSMEDSESETKFNAATGLYWKEYQSD